MKKRIAVVGGGTSSLLFSAFIDTAKYDVTVYEKRTDIARKFLVAGDGGFNLTHAEPIDKMIERYHPEYLLKNALLFFNNVNFRNWLASIGIETFEGTSHRIFPVKGIKPIQVLDAIKKVLNEKKIEIKTNHIWCGFNQDNSLKFNVEGNEVTIQSDEVVFCLGGASWPKTGSDGTWTSYFLQKGIKINSFQASNCAYKVEWENDFIRNFESSALKNIAVSCGTLSKKGELVITAFGLEGSAIYALSPEIRKQLNENKIAHIVIDLKPTLSKDEIYLKIANKGNKSISQKLKTELNLTALQIGLLKSYLNKEDFMDMNKLAEKIKNITLPIVGSASIEEAISTVGGINLNEINGYFELKKLPRHYVIGEMLDWDAPTGGYLLQACSSMGAYTANTLNKK